MSHEILIPNRIMLCPGDSRHFLRDEPENRYDSVVCDPPYALVSISKRFGADDAAPAKGNDAYIRASKGFMGKKWDTGDTAHAVEFWREVLRVLKPGAHLVAFGGTRTYHRLACAIEDAGFEIRDQIGWLFGSGFPKSHNIGDGWGTAIKPAWEPICLARKPLSEKTIAENMWRWRTGALNVDGCRIESELPEGRTRHGGGIYTPVPDSDPSCAVFGRLNPDVRPPSPSGRWPANIVHDGSEEVLAAFPTESSVTGKRSDQSRAASVAGTQWLSDNHESQEHTDGGSPARFFYTAKADASDRVGSKHPTVKPIDLMQWLVRLVTPKGGTCLDPFAGTGTTGEACMREGMRCMLVEREAEYQEDIRRRMRLMMCGPDERKRELAKLAAKGQKEDHGPLFGEPGAPEPASGNNAPPALPPGPDAVSLLAKLRKGAGKVGGIPKITPEAIHGHTD